MLDCIITHGQIVDGRGGSPYPGDIGIYQGKIACITRWDSGLTARRVIDAAMEYVCPGFIDIHRHEDAAVFSPGYGEVQLRQGITSAISGNCGLSVAPFPAPQRARIAAYLKPIIGTLPEDADFETLGDYLELLAQRSLPINVGMLIGNGTIRMAVQGFDRTPLSPQGVVKARAYLEEALSAGAFGVSLGLAYMPETCYDHQGFLDVLEPIRGSGIPLVAHIRGEGNLLVESLEELITLAEALDVPLHISHYKCVGAKNWGHLLRKATGVLERARDRGLKLTVDLYPWTAGASQLAQVLPPQYLEGGLAEAAARLKDAATRRECARLLSVPSQDFENQIDLIGWENIMVSAVHTEQNRWCEGMRITEIAQARGCAPLDAAFNLLVEENGDVAMVNFIACEEDIAAILRYPYSSVISDSVYPAGGIPHPRQYGTFPKLLAEYVRDRRIISLPEAIHKISLGPASVLSIPKKGLIAEGYDADLVIFDLERVENHASYLTPQGLGTGFSYVLVNGVVANDHDRFCGAASGQVLKRL
ncbi:MAG: amidohydrolase family protein [Spirochaetaceae bacterium]|jgi:N-acyl-D-aspartate/D-glutamate deacylase|nr:amidohydrolase family protein [Spirochaetaceae bacterium]